MMDQYTIENEQGQRLRSSEDKKIVTFNTMDEACDYLDYFYGENEAEFMTVVAL